MADYIYLLQTRLTAAQQSALSIIREAARSRAITVFLVGGAVRDMTTGAQIRDLDFAVQGNATKLKKDLQKAGGVLVGEDEAMQSLYFSFPGGVRLEVGSTLSVTYPKPGKPVYKPATILDDLRRRDFTANAMAISLNDGSFGLLMDPLNGVADLENRELRLVSNYGFIEDPARMIRAARFSARLGWSLEEKTQQRYETGKTEGYISALNPAVRKYELEEVFHEEDPLRVLRRLEAEGWAKVLTPVWTSAKANETELNRLRDTVGQLESMGIFPDASAAYFPLLTAKLSPKEVATLKSGFARPGFAEQIGALDAETKAFAVQFAGKTAAAPSDAWKMLFSSPPEPVLWLAHTTKSAPLQARFKAFFNDWSQARTKIPYQLMQEMRITPALPGYDALLDQLFFAVMDGKLDTPRCRKGVPGAVLAACAASAGESASSCGEEGEPSRRSRGRRRLLLLSLSQMRLRRPLRWLWRLRRRLRPVAVAGEGCACGGEEGCFACAREGRSSGCKEGRKDCAGEGRGQKGAGKGCRKEGCRQRKLLRRRLWRKRLLL